ncbi:MAG: putative polymerase epsilon subunit [Actinomycetota bacterium]
MQRSFDDLGVPLAQVTFCVLDIETTGSDRGLDGITEIGAVKVCGGEVLGTFATLVNPGRAISPTITLLTGITERMVATAPRIETVLPTLQEFVGESVIVGHNVGFDMGFLNTALRRSDRQPFSNTVIDTLPLARRLVRDEVRDCRLGTLADHFRLPHRPTHRALDDATATMHLLHLLLERAAGMGVMGLDDLVSLPSMAGHAQASKLALTDRLPRQPGVYRFLDAQGRVLYVGKATNLRQRVRSYFGGDERRKVGPLLRETQRIAHTVMPDALSAEVLELRYLHRLAPRYNKVGTTWQKYCYVRLTTGEAWPRLVITSEPAASGLHIGPLASRSAATTVIEAVHTALPLRRCTGKRSAPCSASQMGTALCPCNTHADADAYWAVVAKAVAALTTSPAIVLEPLWRRVEQLALAQRYEEAALTRDRALAFAAAVDRQRMVDQLRSAGDVGLRLHDTEYHLRDGVLLEVTMPGQLPTGLELPPPDTLPSPNPLPRHAADEVLCLARAIERASHHARLMWSSGEWSRPTSPVPRLTRLSTSAAA